MNQTLFITQEDLGDSMITLIKIEVEKNITCRKLKIQYSQQQNIPSNYLIIILNDQVLCDDDQIEQSNEGTLLIKDVRKMYEELELLKKEKITKKKQQKEIHKCDDELDECLGQNLQLELQYQYQREYYQKITNDLQSQIEQLKSQNEDLSVQIQEQQQQIDQYIQKANADAQTIDSYNQYFIVFNSECNQIYGYQYQSGLLTHFKNESDQFCLQLQQQIATVQQEKDDLEEQMAKNKADSDKKLRKLNQEKTDLEQDLQNTKEQVEKKKKNQNRYLAEINSLKQKLKSSEEELLKQLDSLGYSEEQKNQQLKDQNRLLQRQIEAITQENYQFKQTEKDYRNLQNEYKSKAQQYKQPQQQFENTQTQFTDQINKLTIELRNSDRQKQITNKQGVQQQQMIQQQYEELKQQNNMFKEENAKLNQQATTLTRQLKDSQAILDEYQIYMQGGEKRIQELLQQNQIQKAIITDLHTEKLKLEQTIAGLNGQLQNSRKDQENQKKMDQTKFESLEQQFLISQKKNNQYEATIQKYLQEQNKQNEVLNKLIQQK